MKLRTCFRPHTDGQTWDSNSSSYFKTKIFFLSGVLHLKRELQERMMLYAQWWIGGVRFWALEEEILGKNSLSKDRSLLALPRVGGECMRACPGGGSSWERFCKGRAKRILEFAGHWERDIPVGENSRCTASTNGTFIWKWFMSTLQIPPLAISTLLTRSFSLHLPSVS